MIEKHLKRWSREPFVWGKLDCMLAIADYVKDVTGVDPAEIYRGKYSTALGCARVSGFVEDPVAPFEKCAEVLGLTHTEDPVRGDVGVVEPGIGAVCLGGGKWAAKGKDGVIIGNPIVIAAWSVGCHQL